MTVADQIAMRGDVIIVVLVWAGLGIAYAFLDARWQRRKNRNRRRILAKDRVELTLVSDIEERT